MAQVYLKYQNTKTQSSFILGQISWKWTKQGASVWTQLLWFKESLLSLKATNGSNANSSLVNGCLNTQSASFFYLSVHEMKSLQPFKRLITPAAKCKVCEQWTGGAWKTIDCGDGYLQYRRWRVFEKRNKKKKKQRANLCAIASGKSCSFRC